MKKITVKMLIGASILAFLGNSASATTPHLLNGPDSNPFSRMRKAQPKQRWSGTMISGQRQQRISSHFTSPTSDEFQYLYAPDGSQWYAVCNYDYDEVKHEAFTEKLIKGYTYTFYDSNFNEIGIVRDKVEFEGDEYKCAQVMLDVTVTKGFFNTDSKYEVMVSLSMNTPDYSVNVKTKAYSIESALGDGYSTPISVIPGYPIDAVDCARDKWSEDYYITFLTEEQPQGDIDDYPEIIDFLAGYRQVLTTYAKNGKAVMERKMRMLDLPGDQMNSPGMLCKNVDGKLTLIYAQYEKSFFENPAGMSENQKITEDNRLIIDIYQMKDAYTREMELINSTKIQTIQNDDDSVYCTYYGIGTLMWDKDVDFGTYTSDGRPAFVVTKDDYLFSDDDHYRSSYCVYDADGKCIKTLARNTFDFVMMSDLPGQEPQAMFIDTDDMVFKFVDLYSGNTVAKVDQNLQGNSLSSSTDRVATADGYVYASALSSGALIDDTHIAAPVCWFDRDGEIVRIDNIPTGENVELAQIYMSSDALSPYLFNTDTDLEYVLLVKRRVGQSEGLREELIISSPQKGVLHTFTAEEEKGDIRMVYVMTGVNPEMIIAYMDDDYRFTTDAYSLPFTKFAGGSGSMADPFLIATAGDFQQIKSAPQACFKLVSDIDCGGVLLYPVEEFNGTLDGDGHCISNLSLYTPTYKKTGIFTFCSGATVKNLDFYNASMLLSGSYEAGLIAATSSRSNFENIHVRRLTASGGDFSGEFGGIVGKMWTQSAINGCEVAGADILLPSCPSAGGMTGDIRTGCTITACAFSGDMTVNNTLGGIVGSTTTGDEIISFCHVDANLKAENTVGGIVGFLDRSKVKSNYVEGTIEATKPSKWNNAVALGGIAGELEGDWQGKADVPVVWNLVGVSALIAPDMTGIEEKHPRQFATVHRIVGRTSYNNYFEDEPGKIIYESGVYNNYVVSDIANIDPAFNETSIEGTSFDKNEVDDKWLSQNLSFIFGNSNSAPWNVNSWYAYDPSLYFENMIYMPTKEINVEKGTTFDVDIALLSREPLSEEDIIGSFLCEFDESILEMTGAMSFDEKTLKVGFAAINEGEAKVSVSILSGKAECTVNVNGTMDVVGIESAGSELKYEAGLLTAEGCAVTVYDINGKRLLAGRDQVNTNTLNTGIYVATATDKDGKTVSLKFFK